MNEISRSKTRLAKTRPITIAILAMGGQGGGVLADWLVALAEASGWLAQSTSVPGVAQRTGATIYYIEILQPEPGCSAVLSLMPTPGDVDLVIAAELMEAGRSMLRGLVTPDRTVLICSTHRVFAVSEKQQPGDGAADPALVDIAAQFAAKNVVSFDMEALAIRHGSVISAALFGAVAGANALPFGRAAFEATIRAAGKGVAPSLNAFGAAFEQAGRKAVPPNSTTVEKQFAAMPDTGHTLIVKLRETFPKPLWPMIYTGMLRLAEYQDEAYAAEYLVILERLLRVDKAVAGETRAYGFTLHASKYLAVAMAYDDVIRVADLKTRKARFERVRAEVGAKDGDILYTVEYMHPRVEELCGMLPPRAAAWLESRPALIAWLRRRVDKGRRIRSGTIVSFGLLYAVAGLRRWRRLSSRHCQEVAARDQWLEHAVDTLPDNYDLAEQLLRCRSLIKGYAGTHARGLNKYEIVLSALPLLRRRTDGADWLRRLQQIALADEQGSGLDGALKTIAAL